MKILDMYWFNGGGIVRVDDGDGNIKYYIRSIDKFGSNDEDTDAVFIANWGNRFPNAAGDALFGIT